MIHAKVYKDQETGNDIYIPERFDSYERIEGEELHIVKYDELDPAGKGYIDLIHKIGEMGLKALTEKEKSQVDEHGYRLIKAEPKRFSSNGFTDSEAVYIKKEATKYSLNLPPAFVEQAIVRDIMEFYHGVMDVPFRTEEIIYFHKHYEDLITSPTSVIHKYIQILNERELDITDPVVLRWGGLYTNLGAGCYEVAYWATGTI